MITDDGQRQEWPPAPIAPAITQISHDLALWRGDLTWDDNYPSDAIHVPLPADIAAAHSDLLFSEPPIVKASNAPTEQEREHAQHIIDPLFNDPMTHAALLEAGEIASAAGGVFIRVGWDANLLNKPVLEVVDPDAAIPTFTLGYLTSVQFWSEYTHNRDRYRFVEEHRPGEIEYALFKGDSKLGRRVPLTDIPATSHLAQLVDADSVIKTGTQRLTVVYIPNMRPAKQFRRTAAAAFGRSDYEGVRHLFTQADMILGSWMRDIRLARARLVVRSDFVTPLGFGQGTTFDLEQEIFTTLPNLPDDLGMSAHQFAIRVAEHKSSLKELTDIILRRAGLSQSTFGEQEGIETATGVKAKQQHSTRTRQKKVMWWRPALAHLVRVLADVNTAVHDGQPLPDKVHIDVRFPTETQVSAEEAARTAQLLKNAQAASIETRVRLTHPTWDSQTVREEVDRIYLEEGLGPTIDPSITMT